MQLRRLWSCLTAFLSEQCEGFQNEEGVFGVERSEPWMSSSIYTAEWAPRIMPSCGP